MITKENTEEIVLQFKGSKEVQEERVKNSAQIVADQVFAIIHKKVDNPNDSKSVQKSFEEYHQMKKDLKNYLATNDVNRYEARERVRNAMMEEFENVVIVPCVANAEFNHEQLNEVLFELIPNKKA